MWHYVGGPLSAKPNKGLGLEIFDETGSRRGKAGPREAWEESGKEPRESDGEGRRRGSVDNGQQKRPVGMR